MINVIIAEAEPRKKYIALKGKSGLKTCIASLMRLFFSVFVMVDTYKYGSCLMVDLYKRYRLINLTFVFAQSSLLANYELI